MPTTNAENRAALDTLMQGKTVFVIAHRLNTIRNADQILEVLKNVYRRKKDSYELNYSAAPTLR